MLDLRPFYVAFLMKKVVSGLVFLSVPRVLPSQYYSPNSPLLIILFSHLTLTIYRVIQEKGSIFLVVIVSKMVRKKKLYELLSISEWLPR